MPIDDQSHDLAKRFAALRDEHIFEKVFDNTATPGEVERAAFVSDARHRKGQLETLIRRARLSIDQLEKERGLREKNALVDLLERAARPAESGSQPGAQPSGDAGTKRRWLLTKAATFGGTDIDLNHLRRCQGTLAAGYKDVWERYVRVMGNVARLSDAERKVLQEGGDTLGGFNVPEDFVGELIAKLPTATPIRGLATNLTTVRDIARVPVVNYSSASDDSSGTLYGSPMRPTWLNSDIPASSSATDVTDPSFGQRAIAIHTSMAGIRMTVDQVEDAGFDILQRFGQLFLESYGPFEDNTYLNGTGQGQPMGLLYAGNPDFPSYVAGGAASSITSADCLVALYDALPVQYRGRATWVMSSATHQALRQLKDSQNRYLWATLQVPGMGPGAVQPQDFLLGRPVVIDEFMPAIGANTFPIVFGDWSGYTVVDRIGLEVRVLKEVYAEVNQVKLLTRRRLGGAVTEGWKFKALKVAVS